jgi:hypothetical protein
MFASPAPKRLDEFDSYLIIFKSLSIIGQCPFYMNFLSPRIGVLQIGPMKQNSYYFSENGCISFGSVEIRVIYGRHLGKYICIGGNFRNITVLVLEGPKAILSKPALLV